MTVEYNASQAAEVVGVASSYIRRMCRTGRLTARKIGVTWIINKPDLDKFIAWRRPRTKRN